MSSFWYPVGLKESLDFYVVDAPQRTEGAALNVAKNLPLTFGFRE